MICECPLLLVQQSKLVKLLKCQPDLLDLLGLLIAIELKILIIHFELGGGEGSNEYLCHVGI